MQCPRCHAENRAGRRFCGECGLSFASACPSCGFLNEGSEKFCGGCGRSLTPAPPTAEPRFHSPESYTPKHLAEKILTSKSALEGERKQVTVLFADLKGSMELLADRDPEEARKILDPVLELMMEAVHRYEGTVNQVMGDGIMALFGAPLAHEDHAVRACYAALRMQEAVRRYAEEARRRQGVNVQIRVGLNSGEVVVRAIGSDLHMDYTAVGQTTHLAARMEQFASPGSILATSSTLELVEGFVAVRPLGPVPVRGLADPVEVYEVTGAGPARTRLQAGARRELTRFVGRAAELEQLRRAQQLRLADATRHTNTVAIAHYAMRVLHLLQGDWTKARALIEHPISMHRAGNAVMLARTATCSSAWVLAHLGEESEARSRLREGEQLIARYAASGVVGYRGWAIYSLGRACLLLGRLDEAQDLSERAIEAVPEHTGFVAHSRHLLGDIATHPDRFDAESGEAHYREALVLAEPRGMRPLVAHCHLGLGKLYGRTGKREQARNHLTTATAMYRAMNMRFWLEQAEAVTIAPGGA